MIYPNLDCYYLCVWMLTISKQRLTGPQTTLTTTIRDAAYNSTGVTETEWNNFNQYAAWRNPYYLVYRDYATQFTTSLLTNLTNYYDFQGNSNDLVGSLNGTDTAVTYSNSYGKILQGVRNSSTSGRIAIGSNSDFNFIHTTGIFSINFWMQLTFSNNIARIFQNCTSPAANGIQIYTNPAAYFVVAIYNSSSSSDYTAYAVINPIFSDLNYNMFTVIGDGQFLYIYFNSALMLKCKLGSLGVGNAQNPLNLYNNFGASGSATYNFDELGIWSRALNVAEVAQLYNSGAGLSYPF